MTPDTERRTRRRIRALVRIALVIALIVVVNHLVADLRDIFGADIRPSNEDTVHRMVMAAAVLYTCALALPFVPGVEIGLALIAAFGVKVVPLVYLCTVAGLTLGFLIGRAIPMSALIRLSHDLHLHRTEALLTRFAAAPPDGRLELLLSASSSRLSHALLRHRYIALAVLINLPGNFVIGGGGGISILSGASRLFALPWFIVVVMIAVSPVPLAVMLFGPAFLVE